MRAWRARPPGTRRAALVLAGAALLDGCAAVGDAGGGARTTAGADGGNRTGTSAGAASAAAAVTTVHGTLLVADFGGSTVTFVDPARGPVGSVEVGTAPYGPALGADGRAWVATAEGVAVVDTATRTGPGRMVWGSWCCRTAT
ncbi:hypothetical protein [Streptomyces roseus]|uniref:hypothetical protein n=1 Tax=Streptomyces roseus TaxID=66430 RepID=UPI003F4CCFDE